MKTIVNAIEKPALYEKTKVAFWDDPYISKQMLQAHLDPDLEAASRKHDFIDSSVAWINALVPPVDYPRLLDIGCGPGLYAERFSKSGFRVTGVDFSKRSIYYAQKEAARQKICVDYIYQDYLKLHLDATFDFCTMIYCDYGALSAEDRETVMQKVYQHLKPGGKFLLDVFSMEKYNHFEEKQTWEHCPNGGFWRENEYLAINGFYTYSSCVSLEHITIITENEITPYYVWTTYFTKETLAAEAKKNGFKVCGIFGDVAGKTYSKESETIAILLEK